MLILCEWIFWADFDEFVDVVGVVAGSSICLSIISSANDLSIFIKSYLI